MWRFFSRILTAPLNGTEEPEGLPTWHAIHRKEPGDDRSWEPRRREDATGGHPPEGKPEESQGAGRRPRDDAGGAASPWGSEPQAQERAADREVRGT